MVRGAEKKRKNDAQYRATHKAAISAYRKEYHSRNRLTQIALSRSYYENNKTSLADKKRTFYANNPLNRLIQCAKRRAKKKGIEFSITIEDLHLPNRCPILGIELNHNIGGVAQPNSPSIDRIDPHIGYVKGNVAIISVRANTLKSNMTVDIAARLLAYMSSAGWQ